MRLIDADALGVGRCSRAVLPADYCAGWNGLIELIEQAPTVDAVEVVRCKDCKHWHEEIGWCNEHSHFIGAEGEACHPWESSDWKMLDADDFCSYGERKEK